VPGHDLVDEVDQPGLVLDRGVAREADQDQPVVEEVVAHRRPASAVGTEDQELGERGVVERLLTGRRQPRHLGGEQLLALSA
jgi:hypothetical protein